jgi:hypothetical protein
VMVHIVAPAVALGHDSCHQFWHSCVRTGSGWCSPVHSPQRRTRWDVDAMEEPWEGWRLGAETIQQYTYGDIPLEVAIAMADGVDGRAAERRRKCAEG